MSLKNWIRDHIVDDEPQPDEAVRAWADVLDGAKGAYAKESDR